MAKKESKNTVSDIKFIRDAVLEEAAAACFNSIQLQGPYFSHLVRGLKKSEPKCPDCKTVMVTMHDEHGLYMQCPYCKWDSAGLYKTRPKSVQK